MRDNFHHALQLVLRHEGGYANHPADPGGATMRGITQRTFDSYLERHGQPRRSVRGITQEELEAIYYRQYWLPVGGDDLPSGVDYCVFDGAVHSGPAQAVKWLQRAVGTPADGVVGEITLDACRMSDGAGTVANICDRRMAFLQNLRHWRTFGKGWSRRVSEVRREASRMVEPVPMPQERDPWDGLRDAPLPPDKAAPEEKTPGRSKTLWSVLLQIFSSVGVSVGYWLRDPYVIAALVAMVIFLAIFIGRERLLKIWDEKI